MQNDSQPNPNQDPTPASQPSADTSQPTKPSATNNKKLIIAIGAALGLLLLTLIVLVVMLMAKGDSQDTDTTDTDSTGQSAQQDNDSADDVATDSGREVLMRVPTNDDKLEYVIYKPQQNAANTTVYFAVENVCEGCESGSSVYGAINGFNQRTGSYLVDDNNGKKYSAIKDQDDKVLATTNCNGFIKHGEKVDCFVAFSKVPSGSTVSWVFGSNRIDNIKVE